MATSATHRAESVHIDEQSCRATASVQWLLENECKARTHPITANNQIQMLVCGEEGFASISADLNQARRSVDLVCWGFDPGMELVRDKGTEWPRGETYGELLRRVALRKHNPVKVRLLIWYDYVGGWVQKHMPGYTDSLVNLTSSEWMHVVNAAAGSDGVVMPQRDVKPSLAERRADHCIEWWRWAMNKKNSHLIEVCLRDGDKASIRRSLGTEANRPSSAAGDHLGLVNEKRLLEGSGTHHQKTVLIDYRHDDGARAVGYVMGLNSITGYWDRRAHAFNDPLREYDWGGKTETAQRVKKAGGDMRQVRQVRQDPFQDYACRINGEALEFVHNNFATAWKRAGGGDVAIQPVPGALKTTKFFGQTSRVQVLRTQPQENDKTIKRAYFHASEFARHYLYMENQYFQYEEWSRHLKNKREALRKGFQEAGAKPEAQSILHAFIVIPRPEIVQMAPRTFDTVKSLGRSDQMHDQDIDGKDSGQYLEMKREREAQAQWERDYARWLKTYAPERWTYAAPPMPRPPTVSEVGRDAAWIKEPSATQLEALGLKVLIGMLVSSDDGTSGFKRRTEADKYRQIYIHSKLLVIDDAFFTIGSANLNQRSMAADSEINVATDDPVKARALRKDVWGLHTGGAHDGGDGSPKRIADTFEKWQKLMANNDLRKKGGTPLQGFLCTFRDCKFSFVRYA